MFFSGNFFLSEGLVVFCKHNPALFAHKTGWKGFSVLCHSAHAGSGDEVEILVLAAGSEELHALVNFVVSSDSEGQDLDTVEESLLVDEELLSVPDVVEIFRAVFWVLDSGGVTTSDEVGDATPNAGAGVPEDLSWATIVHG